ncbi:DUF1254 domain-containing protein [Prosthecomicrobium sp. N25]|uniref:DUF1254 domain-containing protein n=1 Tax=Prosthecomicrobium sp. N25 TaxID=3129254 RepID=UPI003076DD13
MPDWKAILGTSLVIGGLGIQGPLSASAAPLSEAEARQIAIEGYVYLYPLISMDVTRRVLTNVAPGAGIGAPANTFAHIPAFPTAEMRQVVRPNFDTLYSSAWLDLTREPVVLQVPDTGGRYYLMPMLDMWTDVFASPGWRTTGTAAGTFLIAPAGWRPDLRERFDEFKLPADTQRLDAPTPHVWIIGRTKTDGPPDYAAVHKVQAGYRLTPLSQWGKEAKPAEFKPDPTVDMKTPPKDQVDTMTGEAYFAYGAEILKVVPPHLTDQAQVARLKRIGFEAGKSFDPAKLDPQVRAALAAAPAAAQRLMKWKTATLASVVNGWSMNVDTMGVYGNYYLKRAIVAQIGLGANQPQDAIYPFNLGDSKGQPLDGRFGYTLHFDKGEMPPADAFWSVTLYDEDGFQAANPINRFAVSSWMPFVYNPDGSLDLHIQNASPGKDREANWLPAPKTPFTLTMRLYAPQGDALTGKWAPPPVIRTEKLPGIVSE